MDSTTRVLLCVPEQRRDLGISVRRLAHLSGVPQSQLDRLERGEIWNVDITAALKAAAVLMVLETYTLPAEEPTAEEAPHTIGFRSAA